MTVQTALPTCPGPVQPCEECRRDFGPHLVKTERPVNTRST